MLSTVSYQPHYAPSLVPSFRRNTKRCSPPKRPSPDDRNTFHLLASLQLAVQTFSSPSHSAPSVRPDILSGGTNGSNLRKQGQLALTFALANHVSVSNSERVTLANKLEDAVDKAFLKEDYRTRIYRVGGFLAADADGSLVWALLNGTIGVVEVAVGEI